MALLDIHVLGSPILRRETQIVQQMTPELRTLITDMFDTMYAARGIGLAAPQVGRSERAVKCRADQCHCYRRQHGRPGHQRRRGCRLHRRRGQHRLGRHRLSLKRRTN